MYAATSGQHQPAASEHHYESGELGRASGASDTHSAASGRELLNIRVNTLTRARNLHHPPSLEREPIYERSSNDSYNSDYEDISDL